VKGTGFTGCGKTRNGGRRGFQPPHKARRINAGFSRGRAFSSNFTRNLEFCRSLFSPYIHDLQKLGALAPEEMGCVPSEKSVQLIKGGFSFRAMRELEWNGEIWQPGFTDHHILDRGDWERQLDYMRLNPIDAKLVGDSALCEFIGLPNIEFPQG
jgi:hypothetical protein